MNDPVVFLASAFILAGFWMLTKHLHALRRERRQSELLRRRVNREIDHPSTWNGGNAA